MLPPYRDNSCVYPWVNTALPVLLIFQLLTGFLGRTTGAENLRWFLWLQGIGGHAIAVDLFFPVALQ